MTPLRTLPFYLLTILALLAGIFAAPGRALAQRVTPDVSAATNFDDTMGPPSREAQRQQRMAQVQQIVGDSGLSSTLSGSTCS